MSDVVFVGIAKRPSDRLSTAPGFQEFHDELLAIPQEQTEQVLAERLRAESLEFGQALTAAPGEKNRCFTAAVRYAVASMAQEQLEIHAGQREPRNPFFLNSRSAGWLQIARLHLNEHPAMEPDAQAAVRGSFFFKAEPPVINGFGDLVTWSLQPDGAYRRYAFAAAVACEKLKPVFPA